MATYRAIAATTLAMERLLEGALGLPENQVRGFQAKDFSSLEDSFLTAGGLSVYL